MSERVLVSACLLGVECRHDGRSKFDGPLEREVVRDGLVVVPFCPEEHGGLKTPRPASWIEKASAADVLDGRDRVVDEHGADVTAQFVKGAEGAVDLCKRLGILRAFLKEKSPSCGTCNTHVASVLINGPGVTTELLRRHGVEVTPIAGNRE